MNTAYDDLVRPAFLTEDDDDLPDMMEDDADTGDVEADDSDDDN
jgi:hypothetical protein